MYRHQLAALAAIAGMASGSAVLPSQPRQTGKFVYPLDQISPRPTSLPESPLELLRRQEEKTTVLQAPDNICGYISERPGASFYCPADYNCFLFTAEATLSGAVACCNTDACNLRLTCMDYSQIEASSCDAGCMVDAFTLKCTDSRLPYCNTASFPGSIYDYWCNDISVSTPQEADTTYPGQSGRTFSDLVLDPSTTSAGDDIPEFGARTSPAADDDATPPVVDGDQDGDEDGDDSDDDDDIDIDGGGGGGGKKKKSNTGAIAGGVVGGVAALGLLGAGAFALLRKKRKQDAAKPAPGTDGNNNNNNFPPANPVMQQNTPPPMGYAGGGMQPQPQQPQSVYDPNYAQQMQAQQQGQYGYPPKQEFGGGGYFNGQQVNVMAVPVDRNDSTSPMSDVNRMSTNQPLASPTLSHTSSFIGGQQQQGGYAPQGAQQGFQQTQPTIHEAGGQQVDHHRGQMHELA